MMIHVFRLKLTFHDLLAPSKGSIAFWTSGSSFTSFTVERLRKSSLRDEKLEANNAIVSSKVKKKKKNAAKVGRELMSHVTCPILEWLHHTKTELWSSQGKRSSGLTREEETGGLQRLVGLRQHSQSASTQASQVPLLKLFSTDHKPISYHLGVASHRPNSSEKFESASSSEENETDPRTCSRMWDGVRLQRTFTVLTAKVEASKKFLLAPPLYGMVMCGVLPSNFTHLLWQSSNRPFTLVPGLQECHRNVRLPVRFVDLMAPHVICLICRNMRFEALETHMVFGHQT